MKQLRKLFLIAVFLLVSKGFSQNCCLEFSGEWLYMLSAIDQPYYAINEGTGAFSFNGDRVANHQTWHGGYRLDAAYRFDCWDKVRVRWTRFNNFSESDSDDENLRPIIIISEQTDPLLGGSIEDAFNFDYLDVFYERDLYSQCPFFLTMDVGVQFSRLDEQELVVYRPANSPFFVNHRSKLRGVGPELGLDVRYALFNCLDVRGRAMFAFLASRKTSAAKEIQGSAIPIVQTESKKYWFATPTVNLRLGLNFELPINPCGSFYPTVNIQVGYEVIHFMKAVDRIYFVAPRTNTGNSFTQQMDFTLHGPYFHLGFCF